MQQKTHKEETSPFVGRPPAEDAAQDRNKWCATEMPMPMPGMPTLG
jgi:hypothetical protein